MRTGIVTLDALSELSDRDSVTQIMASKQLRPTMDIVPGVVALPDYRKNHPPGNGKGVVVGVIDSGIDATHTAFGGRIDRIWDQTVPGGTGVPEGPYGQEITSGNLVQSSDTDGHGTHVSGIAAGDDATFAGVAPAATLIVVKTDFNNAHIADGVRYVFRVASDLEMPAVVNLSLGGHFDAHDGTDGLSAIIDSETGQGCIVCCAAGNEGNDDIHAEVSLLRGVIRDIQFRVPSSSAMPGMREVVINAWYSGQDRAEVAIAGPSGLQTSFCGVGGSKNFVLAGDRVAIQASGPNPNNNDHNIVIIVRPALGATGISPGTWRLRVRGMKVTRGEFHAWVMDDSLGLDVSFRGTTVSDRMKIGSPGSAASAITVASFTSKNAWQDINGNQRSIALPLGTISDFSSEGPLRNHQQKPDVAAPGAFTVAPMSSASTTDPSWQVTAGYCAKAGTSMACPVISGLVALLLQRDAQLTPQMVKQRLQDSSTVPSQPSGSFDPKWGYGLIDSNTL